MKVYTLGVYGRTEESFFRCILDNNIDLFIDVRRRRGMRGKIYSFVNSKTLQRRLLELNVKYFHAKDYSPTTEIRNLQKEVDQRTNTLKRKRAKMSCEFIRAYKETVLQRYPASLLIESIKNEFDETISSICLFCVEAEPEACHRSILAEALNEHLMTQVRHL